MVWKKSWSEILKVKGESKERECGEKDSKKELVKKGSSDVFNEEH